ncbi:calponin homology domain-containing protein DDB_G0272472-like isoform X2 [Drosophila simulans]|uniref:calponin homology domain-containing protein DDB_G0272472-like isoform X2 n=1 Tax=Drosophila simulans TaxID=7240 RepID=UPI00192D12A1|nr:calponin homology domain-containing protein DDB_G0272472-like isoform X2 [Drosophila simulans]
MSARLTYYPVEKRKKEPFSVEVTQSRRNIKPLGSAHKAKSKEINGPDPIASAPPAAAPPAAAPAPGAQRKSVHKCRHNNAAIQRELDAVATAAAAAVSRWKKSPGQPQAQSQGKFHTDAKAHAQTAIQTQKDNIKDSPPRMMQKSKSQIPIAQNRFSSKICQEKKSKEKHHSMLCITRDTFPSDAKHRQQMEILQREEGRQMKQELELQDTQRRRIEAENDPLKETTEQESMTIKEIERKVCEHTEKKADESLSKGQHNDSTTYANVSFHSKKLIGSAHSSIQTQKDNIKDSPPRMRQKSKSQMDAKAPIPQNRFSNKMCQEKKSKEKHHSMLCITRDTFPSDAKHRQQMEILQREEGRQMKQELELQDNQRRRIEAENDPLKETTEQESMTIKEIERKVCEHTEKKADESLSKGQQNNSTTYANVSFHSKKLIGSAHSFIQTQKDNIKDSPPRMRQKSKSQMDAKAPIPRNRFSSKICQEKKSKEKHHSMLCITRDTFPSDAKHRQQMEILQREEGRQMKQELELQDNQRRRIEAENDPLKETTEQESMTIKEIERKVCEHTEKKADESLSKGQQNNSTTYANVSFHSKKLIGSAHSSIQTQKDNIKDSPPRMRQKSKSQMDAKAPIPQNRFSNKMCQEKKSKEKHHSMLCITRDTFPSDAKPRQQMEILQREEGRQMKQELELQDTQRRRIEAENDPLKETTEQESMTIKEIERKVCEHTEKKADESLSKGQHNDSTTYANVSFHSKKLIGSAHSSIQTQKDNIKDSPPRMRQKSQSQMDAKAPIPRNRYSNKMCQEKKSKEKHHSMISITRDTFPLDAMYRLQMELLQREERRQMQRELELKDNQRRRIEAENDPLKGTTEQESMTIKEIERKVCEHTEKKADESLSKGQHNDSTTYAKISSDEKHRIQMEILQRAERWQMQRELELKDNQRRRIEAENDPLKETTEQESMTIKEIKRKVCEHTEKKADESLSKGQHNDSTTYAKISSDEKHRLQMMILQRAERWQMQRELELKDNQRRRIEAENDPLKETTEQESMTIKEIERKVCEHTERKADESLSKGQHNDSTTYAKISSDEKHRLQMMILQRAESWQMQRELELKDNQRRRIEAENDPLKETTEQESMTIKEIERKVCEHTEKKADESLSKGQHNDSTTYANDSFHSKKLIGLEHAPGQDNDSKIADYFLKYTPPKQICEDLERANELNRGHDRIYELFWLDERREEEKYRRMLAQDVQEELPVHSCESCRHRHHKHNHNARFDNLRPTEDDIQEADSSPESN